MACVHMLLDRLLSALIVLSGPLDYEDKQQRLNGFPLQVQVFDGRYTAHTQVHIWLQDRNDNPPQFLHGGNGHRHQINHLLEDAPPGLPVIKLEAVDPDQGDTIEYAFEL
uniref:Cadherin domain-containing protein n=1 Tax=Ditylenchus dipsaci TaxID=166011 RepID=A0A915E6N5_9BILA